MSTYECPLCNGYSTFADKCPQCYGNLVDYGPVSYLLASYSPYRPIEEMKRSDGLIDATSHLCPHTVFCPHCGYNRIVMITEIRM